MDNLPGDACQPQFHVMLRPFSLPTGGVSAIHFQPHLGCPPAVHPQNSNSNLGWLHRPPRKPHDDADPWLTKYTVNNAKCIAKPNHESETHHKMYIPKLMQTQRSQLISISHRGNWFISTLIPWSWHRCRWRNWRHKAKPCCWLWDSWQGHQQPNNSSCQMGFYLQLIWLHYAWCFRWVYFKHFQVMKWWEPSTHHKAAAQEVGVWLRWSVGRLVGWRAAGCRQ